MIVEVCNNNVTARLHTNPPQVGESLAVRSSLGQWTAMDRDDGINATLTYSLLDTLTGRFSVDTSGGIVTLEKQLDFETDRSFTIQLIATDGGAEHLSATATIQVYSSSGLH